MLHRRRTWISVALGAIAAALPALAWAASDGGHGGGTINLDRRSSSGINS
jgi:hypothetical protein